MQGERLIGPLRIEAIKSAALIESLDLNLPEDSDGEEVKAGFGFIG